MEQNELPEVNESKTEINNIQAEQIQDKKRALGFSVLLIFSLVYNGLLLLIMITGLFYPETVNNILQQYYKQVYISPFLSILINSVSLLVFGVSVYGLILLWKFKRKGFIYFATSQAVILLTIIFLLQSFDWINIAVALIILIIIGVNSRNMN